MPGFDNGVVYFENGIDPRGTPPVVNQMGVNGQLLIGSVAAPYVICNTLTAGAGIAIANAPGSITISGAGGGFSWHEVTSATNPNTLVAQNGYIAKGAGAVTFLLPATAAVGDMFVIAGYGNLWTLTQNALQSVTLGSVTSTVGVLGSVTATNIRDTITLVCVTTDTEFQVVASTGNPNFV